MTRSRHPRSDLVLKHGWPTDLKTALQKSASMHKRPSANPVNVAGKKKRPATSMTSDL
jgi:hypothetical protein